MMQRVSCRITTELQEKRRGRKEVQYSGIEVAVEFIQLLDCQDAQKQVKQYPIQGVSILIV
jgi:hypothetical protein